MKIINNKYTSLFAGGLIAVRFLNFGATPTPTAFPILLHPVLTPAATFIPLGTLKPISTLTPIKLIKFENINKRGELDNVKVTAKDATSVTVDNNGTSVKIDVASNTHFRRKFWGQSDINEISVGDNVNVIGRWVAEDKTEIKAVMIRDLSIQKRQGVFFGTVKTITDTGFVMTTIQRGEETVTLGSAKLIDKKGGAIVSSDIQVGQTTRVRGMWDSNSFTITETSEVKDFSLPANSTSTP
jgi:hypothetical protein